MTALRVLSMVTAASALLFAAPVRAQDCSGGVFFASAAVVGGSAIYDIATASKSARRYNERHVSVAPLVNPRSGSYGVMASLSIGRSRQAPRSRMRTTRWVVWRFDHPVF